MLVSELRDKCIYPWEPVLLDIYNGFYQIVSINGNNVHVNNNKEPMFACEILEALEGKFGKMEIVR